MNQMSLVALTNKSAEGATPCAATSSLEGTSADRGAPNSGERSCGGAKMLSLPRSPLEMQGKGGACSGMEHRPSWRSSRAVGPNWETHTPGSFCWQKLILSGHGRNCFCRCLSFRFLPLAETSTSKHHFFDAIHVEVMAYGGVWQKLFCFVLLW